MVEQSKQTVEIDYNRLNNIELADHADKLSLEIKAIEGGAGTSDQDDAGEEQS